MEWSLGLLLLLIGTLSVIHTVPAQSQGQEGFISLDCGLPANEPSPYKEEKTGLQFSSDAAFILSGKIGKVEANSESRYLKPYITLRYFPEGTRNCYNLPVEKGRNHLIRAWFVYRNYDGLDLKPKFDLYLGPNLWVTIDFERVNGTQKEILHIPTSNSLQICLVKTGTTTPLISALEIRPMGKDSYITTSGSLSLLFRVYLSNTIKYMRYPYDVYDREWHPYFEKNNWTEISTNRLVGNSNGYDPPRRTLATAAIPTNPNEPLKVEWSNPEKPDDQYYLYIHFAEIQDLPSNETREFNMIWNGEPMSSDPIVPKTLQISTSFSVTPRTCDKGECSLHLVRTNRSTLPPLINAFEVFTVIQFPQSQTNENDVVAIRNIEATYGLNRINWQGDPCEPQQLRWDALNCSNTVISTPPRITSLNLYASGLTGNIAAAIQNLTLLEKLDLSNNKLTGEVPEFLGNMKSLLVINLSGNDLSGSIPQSLQRKGLELDLQGNPRLSSSGSPTKPHSSGSPTKSHGNNLGVMIAASAGAAAILILVLVL